MQVVCLGLQSAFGNLQSSICNLQFPFGSGVSHDEITLMPSACIVPVLRLYRILLPSMRFGFEPGSPNLNSVVGFPSKMIVSWL